MLKVSGLNRKRLIIAFGIVCALLVILCFRVGYWQIIKADAMTEKAVEQQTRDTPVEAKRGTIYDRNGAELAVSGSSYSVWARPANVKSGSTEEKKQAALDTCVSALSTILDMDAEEVRTLVTKEQSLVKISKGIDKETADKIREKELPGIEISEDTKRYYPLGSFASHLIGSVTDDNVGLSGIELQYNEYLTGVSGRWIKNTDVAGNGLSYGLEKYYEPEDGLSLVLTVDQVIQNYVENAIAKVQKKTSSDRVMCIVMDPENGDVLSMAVTPDYDPNDPRTPTKKSEQKKLEKMTDKEKLEYWNKMWRNPLVSDTYEPGSTFKLLTTSIALEEGLTNMNESFVCTGSYKVADTTLHCWRRGNPHGTQSLKEAVGNSCNPVFMQLGLRTGIEKYYEYMNLFGITGKTEIESFLQEKGISWRIDSTNTGEDYTRNRIRNRVLPYAEKEICSGAGAHLAKEAQLLAETADFVRSCTRQALERCRVEADDLKANACGIEIVEHVGRREGTAEYRSFAPGESLPFRPDQCRGTCETKASPRSRY